MSIDTLRVSGVRNLQQVAIDPHPALNLFTGVNGAGKTSLIESIHLLALGRSFRGGRRLAWLQRGAPAAEIFARVGHHALGLRQTTDDWEARLDGVTVDSRAALTARLPLFVFHPDSHALIGGEPEHRRRLLDVGVFHVEHDYLNHWRNYRRALSQRNACLRNGGADTELAVWERAMVAAGVRVDEARQVYANELGSTLSNIQRDIGPRIPALELRLYSGWKEEQSLAEALATSRDSDRDSGYTRVGPQRADLRVRDAEGLVAGRYSRGQEKIAAMCLLLAQAAHFHRHREQPPIFALDDIGSELDEDHEARIASWLLDSGWQTWVTALDTPAWWDAARPEARRMFHVEQGRVTPVL